MKYGDIFHSSLMGKIDTAGEIIYRAIVVSKTIYFDEGLSSIRKYRKLLQ